jgi:cellulose synthase/poly-beta-1,6-N-acetylglucosamine synthase-like glycosyltransferase
VPQPVNDEELPHVTVQLPLYNERYVARRVIEAAAALDYPCDRLHIQVLDDSTDDTVELIQSRVAHLQARGVHIDLIHRANRVGYKAGALANGLNLTDSELIAIFDADFVPAPDFLRRTVPYFLANKEVGVVQTRWGHLNESDNLLTHSQAIAIDGHFAVEQVARSLGDLIFGFSGSCGLWRRTCIEDAGGWHIDTLTEDFDLSYRAHLKHWRFVFVRDVVVPGEIPPHMAAYKQQQARWAKGSTQVLLKLSQPLMQSDLSFRKRFMGLLQLFQYAIHPIMLLTLVLSPLMLLSRSLDELTLAPLGILGLGVPLLCLFGQQALYPDWLRRCLYFPMTMVFSTGMIVNNSRAALSALLRRPGEFKRTPKFNGVTSQWKRTQYASLTENDMFWEIAFGVYALFAGLLAYSFAPHLVVYFAFYAASFFTVASWGVADRLVVERPLRAAHAAEAEAMGPAGR